MIVIARIHKVDFELQIYCLLSFEKPLYLLLNVKKVLELQCLLNTYLSWPVKVTNFKDIMRLVGNDLSYA